MDFRWGRNLLHRIPILEPMRERERVPINPEGQNREFVTLILYKFAADDPEPLRVIKEILTQANNPARGCTAFTLWETTDDTNLSLSVPIALLDERTDSPSTQAYPQYLARMGDAARPALPALRRALWHRHIFTRRQAGEALCQVETRTPRNEGLANAAQR
jgi:hypothetical protein